MKSHSNSDDLSSRPCQDGEIMILHQGMMAKGFEGVPKIESYTFSKGWSKDQVKRLSDAVDCIVKVNPVLTGKAFYKPGQILCASLGAHSVGKHDFVTHISLTDDEMAKVPSGDSHEETMTFANDYLAPYVHHHQGTVSKEIKNSSPLFDVTMFHLKEDYFCYRVSMSHCLGDITTYYRLMEQISLALNGNELAIKENPLNWDNMSTHEMVPISYSERDISRSWGRAFKFGANVVKGRRTLLKRKVRRLLFSRDAISERKKIELDPSRHNFLSTNDILTSMICKISESSLMMMNISVRERDGYPSRNNDAGNLFCAPHFYTKAGHDPNVIRSITKSVGRYFKPNRIPILPFLQGSVGTVSSWDRPKLIVGEKIKNICHFPGEYWFQGFSLDFAIIYAVDEKCVGVIHNFLNSKDLQSLGISDTLWE